MSVFLLSMTSITDVHQQVFYRHLQYIVFLQNCPRAGFWMLFWGIIRRTVFEDTSPELSKNLLDHFIIDPKTVKAFERDAPWVYMNKKREISIPALGAFDLVKRKYNSKYLQKQSPGSVTQKRLSRNTSEKTYIEKLRWRQFLVNLQACN